MDTCSSAQEDRAAAKPKLAKSKAGLGKAPANSQEGAGAHTAQRTSRGGRLHLCTRVAAVCRGLPWGEMGRLPFTGCTDTCIDIQPLPLPHHLPPSTLAQVQPRQRALLLRQQRRFTEISISELTSRKGIQEAGRQFAEQSTRNRSKTDGAGLDKMDVQANTRRLILALGSCRPVCG